MAGLIENKENILLDNNKKTILAVDDESSILDLLKFNLEKEGFNFISAEDGEEGINKVLNEKPDLLLLDVMIPKMDGLSVCRKVREEKINIPIIMLSARGDEIDKILGLEIGADDYIIVSERIKDKIKDVNIYNNVFGSDHCPVGLDIDLK